MNGWRCTWKLTLKGYPTLKSDAKGILTNRQCVDELGVGTCCPVRDCWYPSKWNRSLKAFIVLLSVVNTKSERLREKFKPRLHTPGQSLHKMDRIVWLSASDIYKNCWKQSLFAIQAFFAGYNFTYFISENVFLGDAWSPAACLCWLL